MTDRARDEQLVREVESTYDRAWAASDIDRLLGCLTEDAVLVNPRGELARGTSQIKDLLAAFLHGRAKGSVHEGRILRVAFVTPDVAVVDGEASIHDPLTPEAPLVTHRFTDVLRQEEAGWKIAHVRAYA